MADNPQRIELNNSDVLIIIDVQNDFLPGGRLAVPDGDLVIPALSGYIDHFSKRRLPIFATRDWHPADHESFTVKGGPWPPHCIAGSEGAAFADKLRLPADTAVFDKGVEAYQQSYSDFSNPLFQQRLTDVGADRLFIGGLATDYCVLDTVRDALDLGYSVMLLMDAIRAVNVHPQDGAKAIDDMLERGAIPVTLSLLDP
ncbi:MAG: isochorismatase family protein [Methylobacter sp.]